MSDYGTHEQPAELSSERIVQIFKCEKCKTRHCRPTIERAPGVTSDPPSQCLYRPGCYPNWQPIDEAPEPEVAYRVTRNYTVCGSCAVAIDLSDDVCHACGIKLKDEPKKPGNHLAGGVNPA